MTETSTATPTPTSTLTPTDTATPTPLIGDVNHDGRVDAADLALVIERLFEPDDTIKNPDADVNADHRITAADLTAVALHLH